MNSAFKHSAAAADRSLASPPAPFALFAGGHPLSPAIEALNRALRSRSDYRAMAGAPAQGRELRTLLRLRRDDKGDWRPRGAYLSFQRAAPERPYRFEACTFDYRYRDQRLSVVNFPHDPRLKALSPMLAQLTPYDAIEVLRYVPRLRATFTARHQGSSALAVAKFAAPEETARSARALQALGRASGVERIGARLPALLGLDGRDRALLWQTRQPGVRLAGGITASNAAAAMERCGRMHASLHALSVAGLPCIGFDAVLAQTRMHADWLAFAGPAHREWFAPLPAALERLRPQEGERGFCHGDFRLTQILDDAGEWSLVDFDAACIADRCQEIGRFLAYLGYDLPWLEEQSMEGVRAEAERAYLGGYCAAAGRMPDLRAVRWHRLCAELAALARRVRSDRCDAAGLALACRRLTRLLGALDSTRSAGGEER